MKIKTAIAKKTNLSRIHKINQKNKAKIVISKTKRARKVMRISNSRNSKISPLRSKRVLNLIVNRIHPVIVLMRKLKNSKP